LGFRRVIIGAVVGVTVLGGGTAAAIQMRKNIQEDQDVRAQAALCESIKAGIKSAGAIHAVGGGSVKVAVLGDSYAAGEHLPDPSTGWVPTLAKSEKWAVGLDAIGGTGFLNGGPCVTHNFASRIADVVSSKPQLLIIQGGLNDHGRDAETETKAVTKILDQAKAIKTVIVIGPADTPKVTDEAPTDAAIKDATETAGRTYISALGWHDLTYIDDGLHLTPEGHAAYARHVAAELP
jgi:lysophospholipase L1-like esterase